MSDSLPPVAKSSTRPELRPSVERAKDIVDRLTDISITTILTVLDSHDDEERQDILESIAKLFCMFCGCRHPVGGMCCCYDGIDTPFPYVASG